jgi:hypothetical protein
VFGARRSRRHDAYTALSESSFRRLLRGLDRGVFCSLDELTTALENWIKLWNASGRPFKWTKSADQITDLICRYC